MIAVEETSCAKKTKPSSVQAKLRQTTHIYNFNDINRGDLLALRAKPTKVHVELRQPRLAYALATIAIEETSHAQITKPSKVQAELRRPRLTRTLATIAVGETSCA